jgi:four helix bundle protein
VHDFTRLTAWKRAIDLAEEVYSCTTAFPTSEKFGLIRQTRQAASSVPANIAEGSGRRTPGEFRQFLSNALGSATELSSHLVLAGRLRLADPSLIGELEARVIEVRRLIVSLMKSLDV